MERYSIVYGGFVPGELIAGKYVVERVIGVGGVGIVLAARHAELDEIVAIKFLLPEMQSRPDIVARFAGEAKAAVRIKSEYAARVFDVGVDPVRGPFLVMEYLEGQNLAGLLEQGPIPAKRAVELMLEVCEALAVAHSNGIIHRDIKPENLFISRRGDGSEVMKVLDFGISKGALSIAASSSSTASLSGPLSRSDSSIVKTLELMGTPLYMSPEQIRSTASVDHRSDIWSLGVVFYEMLTCQIPFPGDTVPKICTRVLETEPAPLHTFPIGVPPGLQAVVDRCFQKDPTKRFQNVAELAIALLPFGPSRARVFAERASSILEASGQSQGITFRFSSAPPPSIEVTGFPTIPGAPPTPHFESSSSSSGPTPILSYPHAIYPTSGAPSSAPDELFNTLTRETRRTRRTVIASVAVLVGVLGVGASFLMNRQDQKAATPPPPIVPPSETAAAAAALPALTPQQPPPASAIGAVTITLGAKPAEARLYLDDTLLPSNPLKRTVMRDGQPHAVRAEAFGYVTRSVALTFDSDKEIVLALDRSNVSTNTNTNVNTAARVTTPHAPAAPSPITPPPSPSPMPMKPVAVSQQPNTIQEVDLPKTKKTVRPVDTNQPW